MELAYAIKPEAVPSKIRHSQVVFPHGVVDLPRLERELQASSGVTIAVAALWVEGNNCVLSFKGGLDHDEISVVDSVVSAHSGLPLLPLPPPMTDDRRPLVAITKTDASKTTIISHDWTDPTTWYSAAVEADKVATDSGDHQLYELSHRNVIDLAHGKVFNEDYIKTKTGTSYRIRVLVNGVAKQEQDVHLGSGGDFTVDYKAGTLHFLQPLAPSDVVTAVYYFATSSLFVVKPAPGKALKVAAVEVQFASDVVLTDSVVFQAMGLVDVFAPQLVAAGAVPSGTKIPLGDPIVYKSFTDFQSEAVRSYPKFPAIGGSNWRATPVDVLVLNWDYVSETQLRSDAGLELHVFLQHDKPFDGWYATATFYCTSESL